MTMNQKKTKKSTKKAATTTSNDENASSTTTEEKKKPNSLEINDIRVGNGPEAKIGKTVNYSKKKIIFYFYLSF